MFKHRFWPARAVEHVESDPCAITYSSRGCTCNNTADRNTHRLFTAVWFLYRSWLMRLAHVLVSLWLLLLPRPLFGRQASIACGGFHTAAVTTEGECYTWGKEDHGMLGCSNEALLQVYITHTRKAKAKRCGEAWRSMAHTVSEFSEFCCCSY